MDNYTAVMIAEGAQAVETEEQALEAWQHLIDTGLAWQLQGHFGRTAQQLIDNGACSATTNLENVMQVILNIGLDHPGGRHLPHWVTAAARLAWFKVLDAKLVQSDSEPTLVLTVDYDFRDAPTLITRIDALAKTLKQDCIAAYWPGERVGFLIGPKAADWGDFNPAFFFMPDGTRLG